MIGMNFKKRGFFLTAIVFAVVMLSLLCSCADTQSEGDGGDSTPVDTADTTPHVPDPDPSYPADSYYILSKEDYEDKTRAAFLGQLAGFLSGHEFATSSDGKCAVAMPDEKFKYLGGLYANNPRADKHIKHVTSGIWEVWFDDDFSVDVVNQYILLDMYRQKYTTCQKLISDGWITYDVWDMGGGQRQAGAFGLISRRNYLPQFAGSTETGNWYSYISEPYLGTDTLGMNAPGMPETARKLAADFSHVTGDRDNVLWAQMFSAMISRAYFESDIELLIRESCAVFPEGSYPLSVVEDVFRVYEKYPDDWRKAYIEFEAKHYVKGDTRDADTDINCGFVLLDLLYGEGDYMKTCKIGSLAGYDCESTCGIALAVLGAIGGCEILPEETNTYIWQDGEGILTNLVAPGHKDDKGLWMIADGLPDRIKISKVLEKYQKNFESVLAEAGGAKDDHYYYIPKQQLLSYKAVEIENGSFESGDTSSFKVNGKVEMTAAATTGFYAVKMSENAEISTTVNGLLKGKTYALTVYAKTTDNASVYLYAKSGDGNAVCTSVHETTGTPKYEAQSTVKRTLVFRAAGTDAEIGVKLTGTGGEYAVVDSFSLVELDEKTVGTVTVNAPADNHAYGQTFSLSVNSDTNKEVYLKLTFDNFNGEITDLPLTVNGQKYSTAALYKTAAASDMQSSNTVYIPILLRKGENTVISIYKGTVYLYEAELVDVSARF